jgi:hypothetical protein
MRFGISQTLFALVALTASAGSALAEEPAASSPASSVENDPNVSQIHGQLVPVGEHNEYQYAFRRFNLSINPIGALVGLYSGSASVALGDNVALRVDGTYYDDPTGSEHISQLGVSAPIYLRRTYQGAFVEPGFIVRKTGHDGSTIEKEEMGPEVLIGWHWTWDSGLNAAIAFGAGRNLHEREDGFDNQDPVFVDGYLRVGYAF